MPLKYDFDIQWIFPRDLFAPAETGALLESTGLRANSRGNYVALFRDPKTVEALKGASEAARTYFKASGFGLSVFDSGAPEGTYPVEDDAAHTDVIRRLTENIADHPLTGEHMNGFDFAAFIETIVASQPIVMPGAVSATSARTVRNARSRAGAEVAVLLAFSALLVVLVGGILKLTGLILQMAAPMV